MEKKKDADESQIFGYSWNLTTTYCVIQLYRE